MVSNVFVLSVTAIFVKKVYKIYTDRQRFLIGVIVLLAIGIGLLGVVYLFHLRDVFQNSQTIMVVGNAEGVYVPQMAEFTVGVTVIDSDKQVAIERVNEQLDMLIVSLQEFGIPSAEMQTQMINVYQMEESIEQDGAHRQTQGQWHVSNFIRIQLHDISQAESLVDILTQSGATDLYGPTYGTDDIEALQLELMAEAMVNAKEKAAYLADSQNMRVGQIISITEGNSTNPFLYQGLGGGSGVTPVNPGTERLQQTVTVTFELHNRYWIF